jgi:hypothetical protein
MSATTPGVPGVTCDLDVNLVGPDEDFVAVPVALHYDTTDPYAVRSTFHTGQGEGVRWVFARELLAAGMTAPVGDGDVRVWPSVTRGRPVVCIGLRSPDGAALLEAPASTVQSFLTQTFRLVPEGSEAQLLDIDRTITSLLG